MTAYGATSDIRRHSKCGAVRGSRGRMTRRVKAWHRWRARRSASDMAGDRMGGAWNRTWRRGSCLQCLLDLWVWQKAFNEDGAERNSALEDLLNMETLSFIFYRLGIRSWYSGPLQHCDGPCCEEQTSM